MPFLLLLGAIPIAVIAFKALCARQVKLLVDQEEDRRNSAIDGFPKDHDQDDGR